MSWTKSDVHIASGLIIVSIGIIIIMQFVVIPAAQKMSDFWVEEAQWQEEWECVEWSNVSMSGLSSIVSKDDLIFARMFLLIELRLCNDTWNCLWERGLVSNNTRISIYEDKRDNEWVWSMCEINNTDPTICHDITSTRLTDDNCTKQEKVRVRK